MQGSERAFPCFSMSLLLLVISNAIDSLPGLPFHRIFSLFLWWSSLFILQSSVFLVIFTVCSCSLKFLYTPLCRSSPIFLLSAPVVLSVLYHTRLFSSSFPSLDFYYLTSIPWFSSLFFLYSLTFHVKDSSNQGFRSSIWSWQEFEPPYSR